MTRSLELQTYCARSCVSFRKTKEEFGGLSNMAAGFPLVVADTPVRTSEALYQACRFPSLPAVQKVIIDARSPMTAKMKSKPHRSATREDWDVIRTRVMRWCLRVKLAQNWATFGALLRATGTHPIVEQSHRDVYWGAKEGEGGMLVGRNVLGQLLIALREDMHTYGRAGFERVGPLSIPDFSLCGSAIGSVGAYDTAPATDTAPQLDIVLP
jgi:type I restriction enzyme, S subunit